MNSPHGSEIHGNRDSEMLEMSLPYAIPIVFGIIMGASELVIGSVKRSRAGSIRADKGSQWAFWVLIPGGIWFAVYVAVRVTVGRFPLSAVLESVAIVLIAAGMALRGYAIFYLGRFFTVDVAVAPDHRLIDTGPYRYVRHPSYTGALLALLGLGLSMGNALSILAISLPLLITYVYRIRVEEAALRAGLGEPYVEYCARTRRLIPGVF